MSARIEFENSKKFDCTTRAKSRVPTMSPPAMRRSRRSARSERWLPVPVGAGIGPAMPWHSDPPGPAARVTTPSILRGRS